MASGAKLTIRVRANRGTSVVSFSTTGKYVSTLVNGYQRQLTGQPIQPTSSTAAFWESVLAIVVANIQGDPTPP